MFYAIKSACKCTLTALGEEPGSPIKIDYLNSFSVSSESEQLTARANGADAIIMDGSRKISFTMDSEVLTNEQMAMMVGGTLEGTKITVKDSIPTKYYSMEGIFTVVNSDGTEEVKKMTFKKIKPQANGEFGMSALEISSFSLTCDAIADEGGVIYEIDKNVGGVGA